MANETLEWSTWNNHEVYTWDALEVGPSETLDKFLGVVLVLSTLVGLPANVISFIYFVKRATTNVSLKLYSVVSLIDCITSLLTIAFAKVLFEGRNPGWFGDIHFCKFWAIAFETISQYSIFLVMMISVTRTVTIIKPQYKINKKAVLIALILFPAENLLERVIGTHKSVRDMYGFSIDQPFCWVNSFVQHVRTIYKALEGLKIGVSSLITFLSFIVSIRKLYGGKKAGSMEKIHRASITIALFTFIFLLCNLPFFFNKLIQTISVYVAYPEYPKNDNLPPPPPPKML